MEKANTCGIDVTKATISEILVNDLMAVIATREVTIRQACEVLDAVRARLSNITIREVPPAVADEVRNGRIHAPRELRLV